jgi:succinate dehydrogenase/fumarate reductase flavoprotein subunit
MKRETVSIEGISMPLHSFNTIIVGSGIAALNAAINLHELGQKNIAIVTNFWGGGTSNNAGSDKQTYYKLSISGEPPDSPLKMAEDLFKGGCMHGDIALCEAQHSIEAFLHLIHLGVPFPHTRHGAYPGYQTDFDTQRRASSAGPSTSKYMFEALARDVKRRKIKIFNNHEVISLLSGEKNGKKYVFGAVGINKKNLNPKNYGFVLFNSKNIVLGTGGPGGIYRDAVYPHHQMGSMGIALEIGAKAQNLTESQFGIASIPFRWNLSGSYQQVIPRYVSTNNNGTEEREFLNDFFPDMGKLINATFLKGYQWPFDPHKIPNYGSSLIDLLVYRERKLYNRRVFLDFTKNPTGSEDLGNFSLQFLTREASQYLKNSNALLQTPIKRLNKLNPMAVTLFRENGIDIAKQYLEISVCAQHNNGGLIGNLWWESNIRHLFPVGEVNGSHGVHRPGGSALNAAQVGAKRAAMYISKRYKGAPYQIKGFISKAEPIVKSNLAKAMGFLSKPKKIWLNIGDSRRELQERMSATAAFIRDPVKIKPAISEAWLQYSNLTKYLRIPSITHLTDAYKNLDLCLTHAIFLESIGEYIAKNGKSRGSYLVLDSKGTCPIKELDEKWKHSLSENDSFVNQNILEIKLTKDLKTIKEWVNIRPIPQEDLWFEKVWEDYRNDDIIK